MSQQAQVKGRETGTQRCAQEQRRDREERRRKRPKHQAVRANKYGQAGLRPRHSDITPSPPPPPSQDVDATSSWREKKKQMAENGEGGKQGRVERHIKWTAWLARQIMQVEFKYKNKASSRRDRAAEQLFTCNAASSKRSSTDTFSKPHFVKLLVLPLQLCQALGQLRNSPLCLSPRTARRQGPPPVSCHGGHFLLQWLRGETTTTQTDVDWHWRALVEASSCPLRQMSHYTYSPGPSDRQTAQTESRDLQNSKRQQLQLATSSQGKPN